MLDNQLRAAPLRYDERRAASERKQQIGSFWSSSVSAAAMRYSIDLNHECFAEKVEIPREAPNKG
jgi:hypothetical protein